MKLKLLALPWYHTNYNTGEFSGKRSFPPLGIATLTAFLKENNISVEQDDLDIRVSDHNEKTRDFDERINIELFADERRINDFTKKGDDHQLEKEGEKILKLTKCKSYDLIGFSLGTDENSSVTGTAVTLGKILKERYDIPIIMGGLIEKSATKTILESTFVDFEILSSRFSSIAEINLLNFCKIFENGVDLENVPGVNYVKNGKYVYWYEDSHGNLFCIDGRRGNYKRKEKVIFTRPCFDGLPMEMYRRKISQKIDGDWYRKNILLLPYFFIRGCPNHCTFCVYSQQPLLGVKDPKKVAEDLEYLSKKYKTKCFFFLNTEINPTYEYAERVAEEIIKKDLDIIWSDCATFKGMNENLLKKLKRAGAARLVFGLESASQKMLKYLQKGFDISRARECLKWSHQLGIWNQLDLICGFPYETLDDVNITINFLKTEKKHIDDINLNRFFVDGLLREYPEKYGIILKEKGKIYRDWSTIPFDEINGLPWEERIKLNIQAFKKLRTARLTQRESNLPEPINTHVVFFIALLQKEFGIKKEKIMAGLKI